MLQEKDDRVHELEKKLAQAQNTLTEKETELEKLQHRAKELEANLQEARHIKAEYEALQVEVQKLKESLEEAKQWQKLTGETQAHGTPPHFQPCLFKWPWHLRASATPYDCILYLLEVPSTLLNSPL